MKKIWKTSKTCDELNKDSTNVFEISVDEFNDTFTILKQPDSIPRGRYQVNIRGRWIESCSYPENQHNIFLFIRGSSMAFDYEVIQEYSEWKDTLIMWCLKENFKLIVNKQEPCKDLGTM